MSAENGCSACRKKDRDRKREEEARGHIGEKYGELTIVDFAGYERTPQGGSCPVMLCRCSCGSEMAIRLRRILGGGAKQCKYCSRKNLEKGHELIDIASKNGTNVFFLQTGRVKSNSSTGITGVSYMQKIGKYRAYINLQIKQYTLGCYEKIEDAAAARKEAEKRFTGVFSNGMPRHIRKNGNAYRI